VSEEQAVGFNRLLHRHREADRETDVERLKKNRRRRRRLPAGKERGMSKDDLADLWEQRGGGTQAASRTRHETTWGS